INPGNSGGPLINMKGELVGINGRIAIRQGVKINTGVGYAIPSNQIKRFLDSFKKDGTVHHATINGLGRLSATKDGGDGALVNEVTEGSDAEKAGFKKGDVIVEADGRAVTHSSRLYGIVGTIPAGETIKVKVKRGDETVELALKLASQALEDAAPQRQANNGGYLGIKMKANDAGVEVEEVTDGSPAATAGLKAGDIVTNFGRRKVANVNELIAAIGRRHPGDKVNVTILRNGEKMEIQVTIGKRASEEK
ncbi:MAG TPA: PDZ domain-containing protein, partial [Planctomycetota bacterium]|nr:PDZ domain-containing protein [Planctomycetota bacterium]